MELQDRILEDLGKTLGVNLTFDEHNQCLISLDKKTFISIRKQEKGLLFYGMLVELSNPPNVNVLECSLSLNLNLTEANQGTIVLDERTNVLMLLKAVYTEITAFELEKVLADFANSVENVTQLLAAIPRGDSTNANDSLAFA